MFWVKLCRFGGCRLHFLDLPIGFRRFCHAKCHIDTVQRVVKPLYHNALRALHRVTWSVTNKAVYAGNRRGSIIDFFPALHIVFQGHGGGRMACCRLRLLNVLCRVVEVCQHGCSKSLWRDSFFKAHVLLNPLAHSPHLLIAQWLLAADNKIIKHTNAGQDQLVKHHEGLQLYTKDWREYLQDGMIQFAEGHICVMSYAKFGTLVEFYPRFVRELELIICDELHKIFWPIGADHERGRSNLFALNTLRELVYGGR